MKTFLLWFSTLAALALALACGGGGGGAGAGSAGEGAVAPNPRAKAAFRPAGSYAARTGDEIALADAADGFALGSRTTLGSADDSVDLELEKDHAYLLVVSRFGLSYAKTVVLEGQVERAMASGVLDPGRISPLTTYLAGLLERQFASANRKAEADRFAFEARELLNGFFAGTVRDFADLQRVYLKDPTLRLSAEFLGRANRVNLLAVLMESVSRLPVTPAPTQRAALQDLFAAFFDEGGANVLLGQLSSPALPALPGREDGGVALAETLAASGAFIIGQELAAPRQVAGLFFFPARSSEEFLGLFAVASYRLSGRIQGASKSGVLVALGGNAARQTYSDASGYFQFDGLGAGIYEVQPHLNRHVFEPPLARVGLSSAERGKSDLSFTSFVKGSVDVPSPDKVLFDITYTSSDGVTLLKGSFKPLSPDLVSYYFRKSLDEVEFVFIDGTTTTGHLTLPQPSEVKTGVRFGAGGTEFTGTYLGSGVGSTHVPAVNQVLLGITYTSSDGTSTVMGAFVRAAPPAPAKVLKGVAYTTDDGRGTQVLGTLSMPPERFVLPGLGYTSDSGQIVNGAARTPATADVLAGVQYSSSSGNLTTGVLVLPTAGQVQYNVAYGPGGSLLGTNTSLFNNSQFTVDPLSGNTVMAGQLTVGGTTVLRDATVSGNLTVVGRTTLGGSRLPTTTGTAGQLLIADGSGGVNWGNNPAIVGGSITGSSITASSGNFTELAVSGNTTLGDAASDPIRLNGSIVGNALIFEGQNFDGKALNLVVAEPTATRTLTLKDQSGTLALISDVDALAANRALSNLASVALNSDLLPGSGNTLNLGSAALPFKDLHIAGTAVIASANITSVDIDGGTLDGVTLGASAPAAGSFTTLAVSSSANLSGNITLGTSSASTLSVGALIRGTNALVFDGASAGGNTLTFAIQDPSAARTLTFRDASGTVALLEDFTSVYATRQLSNLANVAINTSLLTDGSAGIDLGASGNRFGNLYLSGNAVMSGNLEAAGNAVFTGNITLGDAASDRIRLLGAIAGNGFALEGLVADGNTLTLVVAEPTAVRTVTLKNESGTVALLSDLGASAALDNLAAVAINTDLLPGTDGGSSLGSSAKRFRDLYLSGNTSLSGNLQITGNASFTDLAISGNVTLGDAASDTVTLGGTISGNTLRFEGTPGDGAVATLAFANPTANRTLYFRDMSGTVALLSDLAGSFATLQLDNLASVAINTDLLPGTSGAVDLGSSSKKFRNLLLSGNGSIGQELTVSGNGAVSGNLSVSGNVNLGSGAANTVTLAGMLSGNTLNFEGTAGDTFETLFSVANPSADRTLFFRDSSGTVALLSDLASSHATPQLDNLASTAINTDLLPGTSGAVDLGSSSKKFRNLLLSGNGSIGQDLTVSGNGTVSGNLTVSGNVSLGSGAAHTVTIAGMLSGNTLTFEGTAGDTFETLFSVANPSADRAIFFRDASGTVALISDLTGTYATQQLDNLSSTAINTDLLPGTSGAVDLGSSSKKFRNLLLSGNGSIGQELTVSGNGAVSGNLTVSGNVSLGSGAASTVTLAGMLSGNTLTFEGTAGDTFETLLSVANPSADRTIFFRDSSGTVALLSDVPSVTNMATRALDNLSSVSINTSLLTQGSGLVDLGSSGNKFRDLYLAGNATVGGNLSLDGNAVFNGNVTLGDAVADTLTITAILQGGNALVFEGATSDASQTTFTMADPTATRTITFRDASGTVALLSDIAAGAVADLSNLASVSINTSLLTNGGSGIHLGSSGNKFGDLHLSGNANIGNVVYLANGTNSLPSLAFTNDQDTGIYLSATGNLAVVTGGVERLLVDAGGNVGIGTTSMTEKLVVSGNIVPSAASTYTLGTSAVPWNRVVADNYTNLSDERLKENIEPLSYGLREVMRLRPVRYLWKDRPAEGFNLGLIAQEVRQVLPEVVEEGQDARKLLGVEYLQIVPVLIKAAQEQQQEILKLERTLDAQRQAVLDQRRSNDETAAEISELKRLAEALEKSGSRGGTGAGSAP